MGMFLRTLAQGIYENEDKNESVRIIYLLIHAHAWIPRTVLKNVQNLYGTSGFLRFLYDFGQGNQFKKK